MAVNTEIFLGSGASLTFVPEVDLYISIDAAGVGSDKTAFKLDSDMRTSYRLVDNLYIGCVADRYSSGNTHQSTHVIQSNDMHEFTFTPATTISSGDYFIIRSYGAPCFGEFEAATDGIRLNADNWLGLVETGTFPNVDVEMKQMNLSLGSSRNWTHQYKGIKTASGGNVSLIANHGAWLYYALGQCTNVNCIVSNTQAANFRTGSTINDVYIETDVSNSNYTTAQDITTHVNTGPIFYKTSGSSLKALMPPVLIGSDTTGNLDKLTRTTSTATATVAPITYTFNELNSEDLPSFALEQSLAKDSTDLFTETGSASESHTFVRVARGNRVNTLTMTANENEEVKMTMDLNTRAVNKLRQAEDYEARGGQITNSSLFNFAPSGDAELLEPFFFSSGSFSIFGQQFLKITALSLTINNNLMDKRFVGIGSKDVKSALPAQRSYELTFTAIVTDDELFEELFNETLNEGSTISAGLIDIQFDKANTEQIKLQFEDYHLTASNWTVPDDKGPITVDATVMPLRLKTDGCTVKTHWVLQG
jgi:hypothetical protein